MYLCSMLFSLQSEHKVYTVSEKHITDFKNFHWTLNANIIARGSAIVEKPDNNKSHLKTCQLLHTNNNNQFNSTLPRTTLVSQNSLTH